MYYIPQLLTNRHIRHGFSTVEEGNMSFTHGEKEKVVQSRLKFLEQIRIPKERVVFLEVQHGTKIIDASESLAGIGFASSARAIKADAIFTKVKNLALVILTGDCIPVILFDKTNELLGLVHLSRQNTNEAFAQIIISYLKREYNSDISELKIILGPSIKKASYFLPEYPDGFDLVGENIKQLRLKGVPEENIFVDPTDTAASIEFFSHYRASRTDKIEGRFATVAMLV